LGILTINALTAATSCLIPAQADKLSLQAVEQFKGTLEVIKKYTNPLLTVKGIVITRYNGRAIISREYSEMLQEVAESLNTVLYTTRIRECIALKEAQAMQEDIFSYAPNSNAAKDYKALINEIIKGAN
jgi:chromosome partitioning protein